MGTKLTIKPTGKGFDCGEDDFCSQWEGVTENGEKVFVYVKMITATPSALEGLKNARDDVFKGHKTFEVLDEGREYKSVPIYVGTFGITDLQCTDSSEEQS